MIQKIIYTLAEIDPKCARIVLRDMRSTDLASNVRLLAKVKNVQITADITTLNRKLGDAEHKRNLLAHGLWLRHPTKRTLAVRLERGTWEQGTAIQGESRRIKPEAVTITPQYLSQAQREIKETMLLSSALLREIRRELRTLRKTRRKPSGRQNRTHGPVASTPQVRP